MKPVFIVLFFASILFQACHNNNQVNKKNVSIVTHISKSLASDSSNISVDKFYSVVETFKHYTHNTFPPKFIMGNDTVTVLKQVYVIKRNGIDAYTNPEVNRRLKKHYDYGEKFNVIADSAGWYICENNLYKLYVKKTDVVEEVNIPLNNDSLNVGAENDTNGKPKHFTNIQIMLVSRDQFDNMKKTAVNYFEADTQLIKKVNGKFSVKFENGVKDFIDDEEGENNYIGQISSLNAYVIEIGSEEAERSLFYLYDKRTGKMQYRFPTMPYMSIDKKFFMSIDELDDDNTDVYVYVNKSGTNYDYALGRYKNWIAADTSDRFWGEDGCFYLPVLPTMAYRDRWNNPMRLPATYDYRYIRIKVTGPSPPLL